MAEAQLHNVTKKFGKITALDDMSLKVGQGEFIVLLGPTGAGKTTTLRLFAGLEKPDAGRVEIGGADVTALDPASRDVAFVFQQYSLYPHYTVFENLAFPLRAPLRRMSEEVVRRRVGEIAETLRISSKLGNKVTQLSGGEMQRVSIGRALVREPALFLMDEPLSSLDARLREDLRIELKRIQKERGATVLYVTHDQVEAMTLADRIGVMERGRLVQTGTPRDVYGQPGSVYVARMLGSPPVNLLPPGTLGVAAPPGAVSLGVRPEDIVLGAAGGVAAQIVSVERLGAETIVLAEAQGQRLHILLEDNSAVPGEGAAASIAARPGSALFFGADGKRIL